jgi:hypothetical protein
MLSFHIVTTSDQGISPVINKSLHAVLVKICTSGGDQLSHSCNDGVVKKMFLNCILHLIVFMFLCECSLYPPSTNLAIFQHYQDNFQHTESDILLHTKFHGCNLPICVDELNEALFIS